MQTIIRHPSNPLSVKHFASKLEFQARGAGHNHGVLWLDIDRIEQKVDMRQLKQDSSDGARLVHHLNDPTNVWDGLDKYLEDHTIIIKARENKPKRKHATLKYLEKLLTKEKGTRLNDKEKGLLRDLKILYPLYGLKAALNNIHKGEEATEEQLATVVKFIDTFSTVSRWTQL